MVTPRQKQSDAPESLYRPLAEGDVRKLADAALDVLEKSGMAVYSRTAFEALRRAGAEVDEESRTVRFPRALVEDAIDSNPSSIRLCSRDGRNDVVLEATKVHYGTGGDSALRAGPG